jgi:hypothetical protein
MEVKSGLRTGFPVVTWVRKSEKPPLLSVKSRVFQRNVRS